MRKSFFKKTIKIGFTFLILSFILWNFDINPGEVIRNVDEWGFLMINVSIPLIILPFLTANRWKTFLNQVDISESLIYLIKINWISIFQGLILPSSQGSDILRIYYLEKRHPSKRGLAGSTVIIERMIGFVLLCLLSLGFSIYNFEVFKNKEFIYIILLITLLLFLVIFVLLNKRLQNFVSKKSPSNDHFKKIFNYVARVHKAIAYFPYRKILLSSIILILAIQLATITSVYLVFKAYGIHLPLYVHISIYPVIAILSMIPITISGLGIREGFFIYFYVQLGVPAETAVIVSLVNYVIIVLTPAFLGSLIYLYMLIKPKY